MKKVRKNNLLLTTAAVATMLVSSASFACNEGEVCEGLTLEINDNRIVNIDGLGGIDLSGVEIKAVGEVNVELPATVQNGVEFSQTNIGHVKSDLNYKGEWLSGDFGTQASSIANNVSIDLEGSNAVEGGQDNSANIHAEADIELKHLVEIESISVDVTSVANNATIAGTGDTVVDMGQNNTGELVVASLDASFFGQQALSEADIEINVAAIGNNMTVSNDGFVSASLAQHNCADIEAVANVEVNGMRDPINVTAVGNNLQISRINIQ